MNTGRPSESDSSYDISITKYWLLGFIEGEGSFSVVRDESITVFCLGQVSRNKLLLEKIVEFFNSHIGDFYMRKDFIGIYDNVKSKFQNQKAYLEIRSSNLDFLWKVLVPLLKDLKGLTKKHKDFFDWALI